MKHNILKKCNRLVKLPNKTKDKIIQTNNNCRKKMYQKVKYTGALQQDWKFSDIMLVLNKEFLDVIAWKFIQYMYTTWKINASTRAVFLDDNLFCWVWDKIFKKHSEKKTYDGGGMVQGFIKACTVTIVPITYTQTVLRVHENSCHGITGVHSPPPLLNLGPLLIPKLQVSP